MCITWSRERQQRSGEELSPEMRNIIIQASSESRENYEVRRERETEVAVVAATKASESV